jgi:predicted PurR-regulated permease PerM
VYIITVLAIIGLFFLPALLEKIDKWVQWARDQRGQSQRQLADAEAERFRIAEKDDAGKWKDAAREHIARLTSAIASLNEIIGDSLYGIGTLAARDVRCRWGPCLITSRCSDGWVARK